MSNARLSTIEQWLKTLKTLAPTERAKLLVSQFTRIEFSQLDADVRWLLCNELVSVFGTLTDESEHPLKSDAVAHGMVKALQDLFQVSRSFAIDSEDTLEAGITQLSCLALAVRNCHLNYLPIPAGVWSNIHQCYDDVSRSYRRMRATATEHSKRLTDAYRHILLFERMQPSKLLAHEQLNLWGQLAEIAPQLPLMVGLSGELLNTEGDTAFISGEGTGLRINTARISDIVKRLELSDEQKEKFVGSLAARQERGETRTLASGRLKLCIGLDRIHQVLAKGMPFNAFTKHAPNPASLNATSSFPGADPVAQFSPCEPDDAYTWARIIDRSKQGLRLVTERERTPNSRVNDVALCETLKGEHFLALTRWLKQDGDDHYAGMQVTHHGQPVAVSVSNKMGTNSEWLPGLLLGNGKAIVLPYWQMTENAIIWVYGSGYFQRWRVQRVVSSTGSQLFANGSFVQI